MNIDEAKEILVLYRPGLDESDDPLVAEALALADRDPELKRWCADHRTVQNALRRSLRELPVPPQLKQEILQNRSILRPAFPVPARWLALAAAAVLLVVVAWLVRPGSSDGFDNYRHRMVRNAIRQYQMDLHTTDPAVIRNFLATNNAPSDYVLPPGLQQLTTTGAGLLRWRNHPVSMVCFDRGDKRMLFLFVLDRGAVPDEPSETPKVDVISRHSSVTWTSGNNTYVLAGPEELELERKYLKK